jgi:CubicO group peptidase (beta-lactamase class C family)
MDEARLRVAFDLVENAVRSGDLPTAVFAVANQHDVVRCETFGPASERSIYLLASISKAVTATAVMTLVDDGLIVLSDRVARYVPEFGVDGKDAVTVWNLLTHTSGLVDEGIPWQTWRRDRVTGRDILRSVCAARLDYEPGSRFHYYTGSFYVLAEAIERRTGVPYPEYFRDRVFARAGMADTSFDPWELGQGGRVIPPLGMTDDGTASSEEVTRYFASLRWPGVGMFGTIHDLVALGQTLLRDRAARDGHRLLSPAAIDLMSREQTAGIPKLEDGRSSPVRYGLTWRKGTLDGRSTLPGSADVFEHDGAVGTWLWIDPQRDLVFAFLTNQAGYDVHTQAAALSVVYSALR